MAAPAFKPAQRKRIDIATDTDPSETVNTMLGGSESKSSTSDKATKTTLKVKTDKPASASQSKSRAAVPVTIHQTMDDIAPKATEPPKKTQPKALDSAPADIPKANSEEATDNPPVVAEGAGGSPATTTSTATTDTTVSTGTGLSEVELQKLRKTYRIPIEKIARRRSRSYLWALVLISMVVIGIAAAYLFTLSQ